MAIVSGSARREGEGVDLPDADALVEEQIAYYRARAPEYDDWWLRTGRYEPDDDFGRRWDTGKRQLHDALIEFAPRGTVLELAAGTGNLTSQLADIDTVEHITAVDASEEAISIARTKVADNRVSFEMADIFTWRPPSRFDTVVFGFWLSHVPPGRFASFWELLSDALVPGGRVFFTDNAVAVEEAAASGGRQVTTPWSKTWPDSSVSLRTLADGRRYHIVKRGWSASELEQELATVHWSAEVRTFQDLFIAGTAIPQPDR